MNAICITQRAAKGGFKCGIPPPTCVDNQRDATAARAESISAIAASQQPSALFGDVVKIAEEVARMNEELD